MKRVVLKNFFSFVLVLALTIGTVAALSMVTSAKTETAAVEYSRRVREAQADRGAEISVQVEDGVASKMSGVVVFGFILAVPATALLVTSRTGGKNTAKKQTNRRCNTRAESLFRNRV